MSKVNFVDAPEVEKIANDLIEEHHNHLLEANIKYIFRTGEWKSRGDIVYGTTQKVPDKWKFVTGYDFLITISYFEWATIPDRIKVALIDHELAHCARGDDDKEGNPKWVIQNHTIEGFVNVVKRHGMWNEGLRKLDVANDEYRQLDIVPKTGTDD